VRVRQTTHVAVLDREPWYAALVSQEEEENLAVQRGLLCAARLTVNFRAAQSVRSLALTA
jgi:hypothetical protein